MAEFFFFGMRKQSFATTYVCEQRFYIPLNIKTKHTNELDPEN